MAQLIVRNLPDDVKARLARRAKRHGRSLEAEVRAILADAPEPQPAAGSGDDDWTAAFAERIRQTGVTHADIDALNESIGELRANWRLRSVLGGK